MRDDRILRWVLRFYVALVFVFIFAPIAASFVFSFNSDRFPTIPLGHFSTEWYVKAFSNPELWDAAWRRGWPGVSMFRCSRCPPSKCWRWSRARRTDTRNP